MANDTWQYANSHIDTGIDSSKFISAARCIIYVAPYMQPNKKNTGGVETVENMPRTDSSITTTTFRRLGVIQGYNWGEQKQIEMIFEIGSDIPYIIPGRTTGQISISRMLLFSQDILNAFYNAPGVKPAFATNIRSLKDINVPFDMMFVAYNNWDTTKEVTGTDGKKSNVTSVEPSAYRRTFKNCWMQSRNESIAAGQVLIAENVTIMYEQISAVQTDDTILYA